jgi:putative Mg2+ transporter-C (MgtC) family protein
MITWEETLIRLILAAFFGALIGIERERKEWAAGLRTHMMVCVGSCLIMVVSAFGFSDIIHTEGVSLDPSRIAAQVVSGIGFIGAGTIMFLKQGVIRGLTTASGLWTVAAIGLATGGGMYFAAGATTLIALIILWLLKPIENSMFKRTKGTSLTLRVKSDSSTQIPASIKEFVKHEKLQINTFTFEKKETGSITRLKINNIDIHRITHIIRELQENPEVSEIYWENL